MSAPNHRDLQARVAAHSLAWLLAGNLVGLLLAALLIWPDLGRLLAPLTYGRWATVHLNLQLYGWCSVPLLGLLFRWYLPRQGCRVGLWALQAWSGALLFSAVAWLAGEVSVKPFMEWRGPARWMFPAAMLSLALFLARGYALRLREAPETRWTLRLKATALLALSLIPPLLAWASDPKLYPVINPDSGGATGGSLLGSTLGIVALFLGFPWIAGLPLKRRHRMLSAAWLLLALHVGWFMALDHGHRSHHEPAQIAALFSLVIWWPVLLRYLRLFVWPEGATRWLAAFATWGLILLATALFTFLPGVLDSWKFTNALVAHTHMAMAGLLSCFLILVMMAVDPAGRARRVLSDWTNFWFWQSGTWLMGTALLWLGAVEARRPGAVYFSESTSQAAYLVRLLAGLLMTVAVVRWLTALRRSDFNQEPSHDHG